MKFLIITHVVHSKNKQHYFAYEPYVREMNLWIKNVDEVIVIAPFTEKKPTIIEDFYQHSKIDFRKVSSFSLTSLRNGMAAVLLIPGILFQIFKGMQQADHIHLRCPGNMGLLACFIQLFFPSKPKTAKYAGNWDPKSSQPWSYRLQKWILRNSFLTRNMKVLVYGTWPNQSKNIVPFFTASYSETEIQPLNKMAVRAQSRTKFIFVGTLSFGKQPLYAIRLVEQLHQLGYPVQLDLYGEGFLRQELMRYIEQNNLGEFVFLHGNQNQEVLKYAYQQSHFVVLASKSEGWPKVIAEAMFWGCVPIATRVSCIPEMLDYGNRGILLEMELEKDVLAVIAKVNNVADLENKSSAALKWSRNYTLDYFETQIQKLFE